MKRHAPATARNREPIATVLADELPDDGIVLEIASGSGEHAVCFADRFPQVRWQPTDPDGEALQSIATWREEEGTPNLLAPLELDASERHWPIAQADAIFCSNMVHISPPEAAEGLFYGAGRILRVGAPLILYGPFFENEVPTAPSNIAFDESLKARDQRWGLRRGEWMDDLARANGLVRTRRIAMPANNILLVYRRS